MQAADLNREVSIDDTDALNEDTWLMFAPRRGRGGIRATLSLPITANGKVVGGVNLYANQEHAFVGRHEAVPASSAPGPAGR